MEQERNIEEASPGGDAVEIEVAKPTGLSRRDAMEVALAATKTDDTRRVEATKDVSNDPKEAAPNLADSQGKGNNGTTPAPLNPPGELTAEEKAEFAELPRKQQEAIIRRHNGFRSKSDEIRREREQFAREREEFKHIQDMAKEAATFFKARGETEPTHAQLIRALKVVNSIDANTKEAVAEILQAKGIEVPEGFLDGKTLPNPAIEKISSVQSDLEEIKAWKAQRTQEDRLHHNLQTWGTFTSIKNAAGGLKYPDIVGDDEAVIERSARIGQLVGNYGETEISKAFLTLVKSRIPNPSALDLVDQAYRHLGYRIDESTQAPSQEDPRKHIQRSNRAALSVPGRGSSATNGRSVKTFKDPREARRFAYRELKERQGH